jgi:hypothetical protein
VKAKKSATARPWAKKKAAAAHLSPDEQWAADIRERILADCHPWQRDAVEDPGRRVSMLVGRGGAKTTTMRARALIKLVSIKRANILYGALTRPSAEKLMWFKLKDAIFHYGLTEDFELSDYKLRAICRRTGSMYQLTGMQDDADIEGFRGDPFDEVQVDEAASHSPERLERFLDRIVGPRLGERKGCFVVGGTPGTILRGMFYDATRPGSCRADGSPIHRPYQDRALPEYASWRGWSSHAWKLQDIVELGDAPRDALGVTAYARERYPALVANWEEALVEKAEKRYSDDNPVWLREWCGIWAADDTTTVFAYRPERNQWDPFGDGHKLEGLAMLKAAIAALPKESEGVKLSDWRFVDANDMGSAHPYAKNVFALEPTDPTRTLWHVFCFERTGMYARVIADLCLGAEFVDRMLRGERVDHMKSEGVYGITGWPDAAVFDGDQDTIDELQKVYGLRFEKADRNPNSKHGAIEGVNGDFHDGRIKILKGSILEKQLQELQWEEDRFGAVRPSRKQADHCTDDLIYGRKAAITLFDATAGKAPPRPPPAAASVAPPRAPRGSLLDPDEGERGEYHSLLASPEYGD